LYSGFLKSVLDVARRPFWEIIGLLRLFQIDGRRVEYEYIRRHARSEQPAIVNPED
jgi:hypothetical protein